MRSSDSGLVRGTQGSPQTSIEQETLAAVAATNEADLAASVMIDQELVAEMEQAGVRFTRADLIFVTKDATDQTIWLEKGNSGAGLKHILDGNSATHTSGHAQDFLDSFGVQRNDIPYFLYRVIKYGAVIRDNKRQVGRMIQFEKIYYYQGKKFLLAAIGSNGFVVSAYPVSKLKMEENNG